MFNGGDLKNIGPRYASIAAALAPLFFLLICFKSVRHVSYLAAFATIIIVSTCFTLISYGLLFVCSGVTACGDVECPPPPPISALFCSRSPLHFIVCNTFLMYAKFDTAPILIGILTFSMEGIYVLPSVYDAMRDPRKFGLVLDLAYSVATALCAVVGICAYYIWGPETAAVLATNLPSGAFATLIGSMLCLVLTCTYPLQMLPVSTIFDEWVDAAVQYIKSLFRKGGEFEAIAQSDNDTPETKVTFGSIFEVNPKRILSRILQVSITFLVAVALPNLGNLVSLVGCIGFSLGGYLLPALCYYRHFKVKLPRERIGLFFMCIWSIFFVMIPGIITNANAILHPVGGKS